MQCKTALAMTVATHGASCNKIYQELALESFKSIRWYKRLSFMFKIMKEKPPNYLINLVPKSETNIRTRNTGMPTLN